MKAALFIYYIYGKVVSYSFDVLKSIATVVQTVFRMYVVNSQIREVLTPFQCTYLARSLNRLLDPVNIAFPGKTVPSTSEMESIVRIMVSELTAARGDEELKSKSFKFSGF